MQKFVPFLMFESKAEEAMQFYTSVFQPSQVTSILRYGSEEAGEEGTVQLATFTLNGQEFMCIDSNVHHAFSFTPAMSVYVRCQTEEEIDRVFARLAEGGQVLMELGSYPFSRKFGWVNDKFGVSWQLSLEGN
jgi:predicted 3-demethylubiquinone-9 3-methyltransferase (glyoxalase superfamily)